MSSARHGIGGSASNGKVWTREDDELAWRMHWNSHRTYAEIAEKMGRTHSSVYFRVRALKERGGPGEQLKPKTESRRACLCCRRPFPSSWIGNRVCGNCKTTEAYA